MHPWQSGRLHRTHNAIPQGRRWFKPNWMQFRILCDRHSVRSKRELG